jgi:hypothetical protein
MRCAPGIRPCFRCRPVSRVNPSSSGSKTRSWHCDRQDFTGSSPYLRWAEATPFPARSKALDPQLYFFAASFLATSSASAADTLTSGSTPVPSQFVFEIGLIALANGTPIMK